MFSTANPFKTSNQVEAKPIFTSENSLFKIPQPNQEINTKSNDSPISAASDNRVEEEKLEEDIKEKIGSTTATD